MSVTPDDFLKEARNDANRSEEIGLRTSVSRGYYAGYHQALRISRLCPQVSSFDLGNHAALIHQLKSVQKNILGAQSIRTIAAYLTRSRDLRVKADYELSKTVSTSDVRACMGYAENIAEQARQIEEKHRLLSVNPPSIP